jgi:hypothetical protein
VKRRHRVLLLGGALLLLGLLFIPILAAGSWLYMVSILAAARREGVYPTAEEAMLARIERAWIDVERVEIERAGPNAWDGSQPHVWFVTARVVAASRADGKPVGSGRHDLAGSFFLHVRDGWVHVPEGLFPELVGSLMDFYGYER